MQAVRLALFFAFSFIASAQTTGTLSIVNGKIDFSGAVHTATMIVVANVAALPSTGCTVGEVAIVTAATLGQQMYQNSGSGGCVWTQQLNTGSSNGGGITVYSAASLTLSGTQFIPIGGGGLPSATETNVDTASPSAATVTNFDVQMSAAPGMGNSIAFTWRKNATSQSLTCTISGAVATSCSDTTHSFNVSQGDLLTIQIVTTGVLAGTPNLVTSVQFGTTGSNGTVNTATQFQVGEYLAGGTAISGVSIPNCGDSGGNHVNFNSATGVFTCGTSSSSSSPTTNQNIRTFGATFDGGGSALTGTLTRCTNIYESGTISQVVLIADASGSVTVDVQTVAQTSYTGPGSASSITAADIPALSSAVRFSDTTLTGWTTSVAANTVACFVMSSPTTVKWVQATVKFAAN